MISHQCQSIRNQNEYTASINTTNNNKQNVYIEPGRYTHISNNAYHASNGISSTMLKDARISLMYYHRRHIKKEIKFERSEALDFGNLFHTLVLEPEKIKTEFSLPPIIPDNAFTNTDSLKTFIREYNADKPKSAQLKLTGKKEELIETIKSVKPDAVFADELMQAWTNDSSRIRITADQCQLASAMQQPVLKHPEANKIICHPNRSIEVSYYGIDEDTGLEIRVRPDIDPNSQTKCNKVNPWSYIDKLTVMTA